MDNLLGKYAATYSNAKIGELEVTKSGTSYLFSFCGSFIAGEILRLVCFCGDMPIPIGIPIPSGKNLALKKLLTKNALCSMGLLSIDKVLLFPATQKLPEVKSPPEPELQAPAPTAQSQWQPEYEPWNLFDDEELKKACYGLKGALCKQENDSFLLAVPLSPSEPFPMMPVFCFGSTEEICGRQYVVFIIKNGQLV